MPMKTLLNPASTIISINGSSSARLMDASVKNTIPGLALAPFDQGRQEIVLQELLVSDEIVVHEEDVAAPAAGVQAVELGDDLLRGLDAHTVAEQGGDVAEIAVERAAARELDAHAGVSLEVQQFPQGLGVCRKSANSADE